MKDKIDLAVVEFEGLEFVELGDAAKETRQIAPATVAPDSAYFFGWPAREPM